MTQTGIEPIFYTVPDTEETIDEFTDKLLHRHPLQNGLVVIDKVFQECRYFMNDKNFIQTVKNMNFDLMLIDAFAVAPCRFILPHYLGIKYVYQSSLSLDWLLRVPVLPSFHPAVDLTHTFFFSNEMNFWERLFNLVITVVNRFLIPIPFTSDDSLLHKYAPGLTWEDLMLNSELFLITRNYMLEYPTVEFPNIITVPGITIQPAKPLPADLEKLFQAAEHGVVVVSFGSLAQSLNDATIDTLFSAFSKLKQTVVMRFPDGIEAARKKASSNLHLVSWLPQNDMLGHNKTVAFVTHCGNNGLYESIYHGVPMVGVPIFADQFQNAFRVVNHGYGTRVESFDKLTENEFHEAVREVTENRKYLYKVKHASAIIQSQKMLPKEKLAYWVDHVMKFGGAHLRPASQDLPLFKMFMLDVFAFLLLMLIVLLYATCFVIKKCWQKKTQSKGD